ncbi:YusW family protein [Oceanobacillus neutriphilus]|uniref:YusW-like protein n=1 Tax=Oceanobacillus neutriphilus TaxID=531815 RepID=A0ABQ2NM02_9BACI|nr:YusW family protein [Oceanobacillus neutriphilus]GGP06845.1 hypothetical protein GCM10011346_00210 [Oceanobacillus neutriphilus]
MKRMIVPFAGILLVSLILAACNDTNGNETEADQDTNIANNNEQDNSTGEQEGNSSNADTSNGEADSTNDEMKQKLDNLNYSEIEVEIDYGKDKEYEAEIEQDNGIIEAELEDELNGENLTGKEAFDKIYPSVEKLTIQQDTDKNDAINQTLDALNLDSDYIKFELELTLQDGTKIEFEDKK